MRIKLSPQQWEKIRQGYENGHKFGCSCDVCQAAEELIEQACKWHSWEQPEIVRQSICQMVAMGPDAYAVY